MKQIKEHIDKIVKNVINEMLHEQKQKNVQKKLAENITNKVMKSINEANNDNKRNAVMKALKDNVYKHSEIAYKLYDCHSQSEKDTARSLFSKKFRQEPDDDGQVRTFDDNEVNKLYNMIRQRK